GVGLGQVEFDRVCHHRDITSFGGWRPVPLSCSWSDADKGGGPSCCPVRRVPAGWLERTPGVWHRSRTGVRSLAGASTVERGSTLRKQHGALRVHSSTESVESACGSVLTLWKSLWTTSETSCAMPTVHTL